MFVSLDDADPGKRPLSSSTPTIIEDGKNVLAVVGASGGSLIITATLQVILGLLDWNMHPLDAIAMPRLHHQLAPDNIVAESTYNPKILDALLRKGHSIKTATSFSGVAAIKRLPTGLIQAGGDTRKRGFASVY